MKKLVLALFAISTIFTLSSCGSDDPEKVEKFFSGTALHSTDLNAYKNNDKVTVKMPATDLDALLKGSTGYGAPISSCKFSIKESDIVIVGLKDGVILKNLKLTMGSISKDFGNVSSINGASKSIINNETLGFFQQILDKIAKDKRISGIDVSFDPSDDVNAKIELSLKGEFSYWQVVE